MIKSSHVQKRRVGRWWVGSSLYKIDNAQIDKGFDKKTGKAVALKWHRLIGFDLDDAENVCCCANELESMNVIRHNNVHRLYAYNLNISYPVTNDKKIDSALMILEYHPNGQLFDIIYHTNALSETLARTYFRQIIDGLEACHNRGIIHRDLKLENLLLDRKFNIKISNFHWSKVCCNINYMLLSDL